MTLISNPAILMCKYARSRCFATGKPAGIQDTRGWILHCRHIAGGLHSHTQKGAAADSADKKCGRCQHQGGVGAAAQIDGQHNLQQGWEREGRESPRPSRQALSNAPPSHTTNIHHPVRARWIVGEHWTEMIPLNSDHSGWCVTTNSTHGKYGRG